ncbi:hypothetical protein [Actinomadura flavalba]|uniref:hypothetical protein n=1 Tax=Actinomadura flavalba TaxID=1120938 RepID=UPI0003A1DE07|nr:hypothetical protein [Actinomadura flavalba]
MASARSRHADGSAANRASAASSTSGTATLEELAAVRMRVDVPVAADESIRRAEIAARDCGSHRQWCRRRRCYWALAGAVGLPPGRCPTVAAAVHSTGTG